MAADSRGPSRPPDDDLARRYRRYRLQVFVATWLAYAGFYLTRKSFAVAKVPLSHGEAAWSLADMAWVDGAYLTAYAAGQFLWGICGDRFGTRAVIVSGLLASVLVAVVCGLAPSVAAMGLLLCLQGLCQATGWGPLAKNVGEFFSQRERGWVMGLWCTNYAVGGFLATRLAGWAAEQWGWRFAFWVPAAALLGVWFLFLLWQRDRPEDVGLPPIEDFHGEPAAVVEAGDTLADEPEGSWQVIADVLRSRMVLLLAAVYFFIKQPRYLILFSAPLVIHERLGLGEKASSDLASMFELAGPFGVLVGGFLSDRVFRSRRMPLSVLCLVAAGLLLAFFPRLPPTYSATWAGLFALGFLLYIPDSLVSATAAIDFGTKRGASTAAGVINGCGSVGAILGGTLPGWIPGLVGSDAPVWDSVFVGLSISMFAAAALLLPQWNALPPTAAALPKKDASR